MRLLMGLLLNGLALIGQDFSVDRVSRELAPLDYRVLVLENEKVEVYSKGVAATDRFLPCSTFKLPHALIALECGVISLEHNEQRCNPAECHADHGLIGLEGAIRESCVSYFRQTARRIGKSRMESWLAKLGYPQASFTWALDGFWLDGGAFRLTVEEQLMWIRRFYTQALPVQKTHLEAVRVMSLRTRGPGYVLYGKTGASKDEYGWFIGRIQQDHRDRFVAILLRGKGATGSRAQAALERLLSRK